MKQMKIIGKSIRAVSCFNFIISKYLIKVRGANELEEKICHQLPHQINLFHKVSE